MPRILLAIILAAGITLGLFTLMQALIKSGDQQLTEPPQGSVLDFVRVKKDEVIEQKDRKPKKLPKPEQPPPDLPQPEMDTASSDSQGTSFDFSADVGAEMVLEGGLALESGDGEYLPIVKVAPVYPRRALSRGIEGYVIVEFTVTKQGAVSAPRIIEAEPAGIFEQAAVDAALKFKYKPRVINGEATEVAGVQNRISFQIDG